MKKNNFKIGEKNKYLTLKVIVGYILFGIIAFGSIFYILNVIEKMTIDDPAEQKDREKAYLITRTISSLNESAGIGQPIGMTEDHYTLFNQMMDETLLYLDDLRQMLTDSMHIQGIDTIEMLIEDKRLNTLQLYTIWKDMNTERLYYKDMKRTKADTLVTQVEIKEQVQTKKDSVLVPRTKKGFFKRLADAFVPPKEDVGVVINTTSNVQTDTLVNVYNPTDTINSVIKQLQEQIAKDRKQLTYQLYDKAAELRHNNELINIRINEILYAIEEEENNASMERIANKQQLFAQSSRILGFVAIAAILVILIFILIINRDISKSKFYRIQLEKAKQYADELLIKQEKFMLAISHDIRAPMSSILGYIELLLRKKPDERQRYYLENMISSSNHILSLVNDLLDFHRLDSGKMEIQKVAYNGKHLFDDIFVSFKPIANAKNLDLRMELEGEGWDMTYEGDPIRIRQVVGNLMSNALKFTQEGEVVLSARLEGDKLYIAVRDTGAGIPQDEQESIFGEFTRLKKEKEAEGFGLGLSITSMLVELMGGIISLKSILGEGSTFSVELPVYRLDKPLSLEKELPVALNTINQSINCLLVDDDALQLVLTEELLKQSTVKVEKCTDPGKVLGLLEKGGYDVVITDIQMPGLDGFELVSLIRNSDIPNAKTLPVIALSASVANEKAVYLDAGFTGFLNKPFTASDLIAVLNQLLSTDLQMDSKLDFTSLADFAGDDKETLASILKTFEMETIENVKLLQSALEQKDRKQASKVSHKMIPMFTMIGANHLVQRLRLLEKNDEEMSDELWCSSMIELKSHIELVMSDVSEKCVDYGVEKIHTST